VNSSDLFSLLEDFNFLAGLKSELLLLLLLMLLIECLNDAEAKADDWSELDCFVKLFEVSFILFDLSSCGLKIERSLVAASGADALFVVADDNVNLLLGEIILLLLLLLLLFDCKELLIE